MSRRFWKGKRVFVTGHTGFKGAWLSLWLRRLGADVTGYSLKPPTQPNLFDALRLDKQIRSLRGDIRDVASLTAAVRRFRPDVIVHMAAQSLVRASYADPLGTYATNVQGTANVLEAAHRSERARVVISVTTDKCYENTGKSSGYNEADPLGGHDPYSSSKACAEIVTSAYRRSFFSRRRGVGLASARAGNVIGGGDWARDRLIPDLMRALIARKPVVIRHPAAVRPWQFVLEPLAGYLALAEKLWESPERYSEAWNFGPAATGGKPVGWIVKRVAEAFPGELKVTIRPEKHLHEAKTLTLNCAKARKRLGVRPQLSIAETIDWTLAWYDGYRRGAKLLDLSDLQIALYEERLDL